jgi:hypothetical protein
LPDPDDERILELAVETRATIVTHNTRHFMDASRFWVLLRTPGEFLRDLRETYEH